VRRAVGGLPVIRLAVVGEIAKRRAARETVGRAVGGVVGQAGSVRRTAGEAS
jgi:hypothetical protein